MLTTIEGLARQAATSSPNRMMTDEEIEAIYGKLKHYGSLVHADHRLAGADVASVTVRSPLCGSELTLDAVIAGNRVQQLGWAVRACSLGQATTGILTLHFDALERKEVARVGAQLRQILHGAHMACDWPELEIFTFAQDIPVRHESALLPFKALELLFERAVRRA